MSSEFKIVEEAKKPLSMHPKKFALWLFIASVIMLFAAWTSAYIVKRGDIGWAEIVLPGQFYVNTVIILFSSASMIWAVRTARKDNFQNLRLAISITTLLGVAFLIGQFLAYGEMVALKQFLTGGNVSHSFIYVISGAHAAHVIGGVIYLLIVLVSAYRNRIHSGDMTSLEMCATYWHFLGVLWVYLFVFLILNP
ncbi:MAG TPA: cytochrome c oxidase subunit 3 [Chryseosolibacter sp.]|nr:cytochrome c oxidase subunit 3 [Chryseosolibacter sp.]